MTCQAHEVVDARGLVTHDDVDFIIKIVQDLPAPMLRIVDIGAGGGTTALAALIGAFPRPTQMISIDTNDLNLIETHTQTRHYREVSGHAFTWDKIFANSIRAVAEVEGTFDFIMLDTSHELEETLGELAAWLPKLGPQGMFWAHDYSAPSFPGCKQAIDSLAKLGLIQILSEKGLGVCFRRSASSS